MLSEKTIQSENEILQDLLIIAITEYDDKLQRIQDDVKVTNSIEIQNSEGKIGRGWWGPPKGTHTGSKQGKSGLDSQGMGSIDLSEVNNLPKPAQIEGERVTDSRIDALYAYQGASAETINKALRDGNINAPVLQKYQKDLDNSFTQRIKEDAVIYRGVNDDYLKAEVGDKVNFKEYLSTAKYQTVAERPEFTAGPEPCIYHFSVKKGQKCTTFPTEIQQHEILLPRNMSGKITKIEIDDKFKHYHIELK